LATRGFARDEFAEVADILAGSLLPSPDTTTLRQRVTSLADRFPLYPTLTPFTG